MNIHEYQAKELLSKMGVQVLWNYYQSYQTTFNRDLQISSPNAAITIIDAINPIY